MVKIVESWMGRCPSCSEAHWFKRYKPERIRRKVMLSCSSCGSSIRPQLVPGGLHVNYLTVWNEQELCPSVDRILQFMQYDEEVMGCEILIPA